MSGYGDDVLGHDTRGRLGMRMQILAAMAPLPNEATLPPGRKKIKIVGVPGGKKSSVDFVMEV